MIRTISEIHALPPRFSGTYLCVCVWIFGLVSGIDSKVVPAFSEWILCRGGIIELTTGFLRARIPVY